MAIFVIFTFVILNTCNFFTNLPQVAGDPTEQSGKHALSSYCEVMMKRPITDAELGPAMITDSIHETLFLAASNYPFNGTKLVPFSDLKMQILATAFANLLLKLPIMEDVNDILFDSAWDACHSANYTRSTPKDEIVQKFFDIMIKKIESTILANASLAPLYKEEKSKTEKIPLPAVLSAAVDFSPKTNQRYLNFVARKRVLRYALKPCYEQTRQNGRVPEAFRYHYLSQAVLQLARTDKANRTEPIFDETIKIAGEKLQASADRNFDFFVIFFSTLEEKLMKDPELENVRMTVKNDLTKKYGI